MNYYSEFDPFAAAWLRALIERGLIAPGVVDERSITDVQPDDLVGFTQCHFFAGIGGWSYALRLAGWPDDQPVWTGSCPCQPFSTAGKQRGTNDERHLWPEFARLIGHAKPEYVFGEQVASAAGRDWLSSVCLDLETMGYAVGAADLCAASVGAPHIRQRLWWGGTPDGPPHLVETGRTPLGCPQSESIQTAQSAPASTSYPDKSHSSDGWPTPNAHDPRLGYQRRRGDTKGSQKSLETVMVDAFDSNRGNPTMKAWKHGPARITKHGEMLTGSLAEMDSGGQLNPAHSRWVMGYPPEWCDCAVTAMQSFPKSRKRSSKPSLKP